MAFAPMRDGKTNLQMRAIWPAFFYGVDFVLIYMFNFSQMIKSRGGQT
jgi:hypothetical protein